MKKLAAAVKNAKQDTARIMTMQLRQSALEHGWDADVVRNLRVEHDNGTFSAKVHPSVADRAFTHEYGNETTRPTAVIRKFMNDPINTENAFMARINHHWGKK